MGFTIWAAMSPEWCEDEYRPGASRLVVRGASWNDYDPDRLLSSQRNSVLPGNRNVYDGFRCVVGPFSERGR